MIDPRPTIKSQKKAQAFNDASLKDTGRPDYSTYTPAHIWGIFKPFCNVTNGEDVFIATWNIQHPSIMHDQIIKGMCRSKHVRILVGYNRAEHHLDRIRTNLLDWKAYGFHVRALPNFHAKIWGVGNRAWVGSCNFVPNTIHNYMMEEPWALVHDWISFYWQQAKDFTETTKLELLPQPKSIVSERDRWWD